MGREILDEAYRHFALEGRHYEYGRGDLSKRNAVGNHHTDPSRDERDLDGDGYYGVDCSSLVWRGLKNAGYDVGDTPFDTTKLFTGTKTSAYAEKHFDVIPAAEASKTPGSLQPGDIIMFNGQHGRHVGIFKGYDDKGNIEFFGSQVSTGPALTTARGHGSYWNGGDFEIVGALRAKPEFQKHEPLHGRAHVDVPPATEAGGHRPHGAPAAPASGHDDRHSGHDEYLRKGARGGDIISLQQDLAKLGYPSREAPLHADGKFGALTDDALRKFQRDHGLKPDGIAGPKTMDALRHQLEQKHESHAADRAPLRLDNPAHPEHALYKQALDAVHRLDAAHQREPNHLSGQLAGSLTVRAREEGLQRIDHAVLSEDAKRTYAVQGDLSSPFKRVAEVDTAQAVNTPLEKSSAALEQMATASSHQQQKPQQAPVQTGPGVSI